MARITSHLVAAALAASALVLTTAPARAQDGDSPSEANPVCGPEVSGGRFDMAAIGSKIAGTWSARAPGLGVTKGVQTFTISIKVEYGRVYAEGNGTRIALNPVHGTRKALRFDPVRQKALPVEAHAVDMSLEDVELVTDCDLTIAPQFTWTYGSGSRTSAGIYTFLSPNFAIGTMWNSGGGAREVFLSR